MTRKIFALVALVGLGACGLKTQDAPAPVGPSEFALSLSLTATPDIMTQDGHQTSTITVVARDAFSQPVRGVSLLAEIFVDGGQQDFGTLSSRTFSTGNDGVATVSYLSPPAPSALAAANHLVTIRVTPVGTDFANTSSRVVAIRMTPPSIIVPPSQLVVDFIVLPSTPKVNDNVSFDGSISSDSDPAAHITSYDWTFSDGLAKTGVQVSHDFGVAGSYIVTLTVKDDQGRSVSKSKSLTVAAK